MEFFYTLSYILRAGEKRQTSIELSNNKNDRSEAKGTNNLRILLLGERTEVSGKPGVYYFSGPVKKLNSSM